tara:strand:- start:1187 stop:1537 length:351 start_codon:yes stop_codon:yes gene_type:complete
MIKIKEWLLDKEKDAELKIEDVVLHGCAGGVSGVVYYRETETFHDKHEQEIWNALDEHAQLEGIKVMDLVHRLAKEASSITQLKNDIVWWAIEVAAGEILLERSRKENVAFEEVTP